LVVDISHREDMGHIVLSNFEQQELAQDIQEELFLILIYIILLVQEEFDSLEYQEVMNLNNYKN
jgi:hypothetical protein